MVPFQHTTFNLRKHIIYTSFIHTTHCVYKIVIIPADGLMTSYVIDLLDIQ